MIDDYFFFERHAADIFIMKGFAGVHNIAGTKQIGMAIAQIFDGGLGGSTGEDNIGRQAMFCHKPFNKRNLMDF